jgi:hypothetical protein
VIGQQQDAMMAGNLPDVQIREASSDLWAETGRELRGEFVSLIRLCVKQKVGKHPLRVVQERIGDAVVLCVSVRNRLNTRLSKQIDLSMRIARLDDAT